MVNKPETLPERVHIIKTLLRHPCGVGERWTKNLANELVDIAEELIRKGAEDEN